MGVQAERSRTARVARAVRSAADDVAALAAEVGQGGATIAGPLDGIVVADLSRVLSGPWCTMTLGDLGADVIKVERPGSGDETRGWGPPFVGGESAYYLSTNRNKRSIALDLSRADHHEAVRRLISRADILIENFRPGTIDRLGFGEDACRAINPAIIYASITGFGESGPQRDAPGYDFVIQGQGGLMSITGESGGRPLKVGVAISDLTAGLYATIGILAALHQRDVTGVGTRVHVSLLGTQVSWLANQAANYLIGGAEPTRMGNTHPNIVPYQVFEASDGPFVLAVANQTHWKSLCTALARADLHEDARYATNADRVVHRAELTDELSSIFSTQGRSDWLSLFARAEVPCGPINSIADVFADEQVRALQMVQEIEHPSAGSVKLVRSPIDTPGVAITRAPPLLGEHTAEVLRELGYDETQIEGLTR